MQVEASPVAIGIEPVQTERFHGLVEILMKTVQKAFCIFLGIYSYIPLWFCAVQYKNFTYTRVPDES
jgi:hypothetical protein